VQSTHLAVNTAQCPFHLKNKGIGILITDHNYREVLDTCDHSYVLHDGVIITEGNKKPTISPLCTKNETPETTSLPE
jgi:ABC-type lipopolysaccharide export system ATPase subunit